MIAFNRDKRLENYIRYQVAPKKNHYWIPILGSQTPDYEQPQKRFGSYRKLGNRITDSIVSHSGSFSSVKHWPNIVSANHHPNQNKKSGYDKWMPWWILVWFGLIGYWWIAVNVIGLDLQTALIIGMAIAFVSALWWNAHDI